MFIYNFYDQAINYAVIKVLLHLLQQLLLLFEGDICKYYTPILKKILKMYSFTIHITFNCLDFFDTLLG